MTSWKGAFVAVLMSGVVIGILTGHIALWTAVGAALGAVIERVDGRPLPRFLKAEFFQPLGMDSSCLELEDRLGEIRRASGVLEAESARTVAEIEQRGSFSDSGHLGFASHGST